MEHRLTPLLAPRSVAVVGASARTGSPGESVLTMLRRGGFDGDIYPINPRYESLDGQPCLPSLAAIESAPDLTILTVGDPRLEQALVDTISRGSRAAVIFGGANLPDDHGGQFKARLKAIAAEAALPLCGGNGMGFLNFDAGVFATFMSPPYDFTPGGVTLISHSGSSWSTLTLNDGRIGFNLSVSAGQELTVTAAEYAEYALNQPATRVVGLILETVRDPDIFARMAATANERGIPLVVLKVGRSAAAAQFAIGHSGAIAGDDAAYDAVFKHYGVCRVRTLEELAATLLLFSETQGIGAGGLAASMDSGCERELLVDLASDADVSFPEVNEHTTARLTEILDPGLAPVNPLDAWGSSTDYVPILTESFSALVGDPRIALGAIAHSPRDGGALSEVWANVCIHAHHEHNKPVVMITNFPWTRHAAILERLTAAGIPVLEGMDNGLAAVRHVFGYRDFLQATTDREPLPKQVPAAIRARSAELLSTGEILGEQQTLSLCADYGIPIVRMAHVTCIADVIAAWQSIGGPIALKTASEGVLHKTEVNGVFLGLDDEAAITSAYDDLRTRIGPEVLVCEMAHPGHEIAFGIVRDATFGTLVLVAMGGIAVELEPDRCIALPPFGPEKARAMIESLRGFRQLNGFRGREGADITAMAEALSRFSLLAADHGEQIAECDLNPLLASASGVVAVDGLLVTR